MDTTLIIILVIGLVFSFIILPLIFKYTLNLSDNSQIVGGVVVGLLTTSIILLSYTNSIGDEVDPNYPHHPHHKKHTIPYIHTPMAMYKVTKPRDYKNGEEERQKSHDGRSGRSGRSGDSGDSGDSGRSGSKRSGELGTHNDNTYGDKSTYGSHGSLSQQAKALQNDVKKGDSTAMIDKKANALRQAEQKAGPPTRSNTSSR